MAISGGDGSIILTTKVDETGLKKGLGSMKKLGATVGKAFLAIGAAAATATVAITKMTVSAYAEFEQLAGGVEKIFDQANIAQIMEDANNAFMELNMSVNDYLRTMNDIGATFSATMGDQKGYDTARQGLLAISDYASGTGKNIDLLSEKFTMITRSASSYQSIADQFSGILPATSADFLAQAKAAGFLSNQYTKLTEVPIAEYQQAVTQMLSKGVDELGLAGNTAREAATTISGSLAMTKASWQNLLTAMAGGGDLDRAINNFVYSLEKFTANIVPVIERTLLGLGQAIQRTLPMLVQTVVSALVQQIPNLVVAVYNMIVGLFKGIVLGIKALFTGGTAKATEVIKGNVETGAENTEQMAENMEKTAEETKKAGKEAKKSLAAFDDLNILSSGASGGVENETTTPSVNVGGIGVGGMAEAEQPSGDGLSGMVQEIKANLDYLLPTISLGLVAIGLILLAMGNIPWGIGFIIGGAYLYSVTERSEGAFDFQVIKEDFQKIVDNIEEILIGIGIILLFLGQIGWGIGFIIAGAVIYTVKELQSEAYDTADISTKLAIIMEAVSLALIGIGVMLIFFGQVALGLGFIFVGKELLNVQEQQLSEGNVTTKLQQFMTDNSGLIVGIGLALVVIGLICFCFGLVTPLTFGIFMAGAAALASEETMNPGAIKNEITKFLTENSGLIVGISLAVLVLGIILCLCGVITPLSIGMIVFGAVGLATAIVLNWDAIKNNVTKFLTDNSGLIVGVSLAILVLGIILCVCGIITPLSIGMIVFGAVGLATEMALNWNSIVNSVKTFLFENSTLLALISGGLLILGILLCVTGVGIPLGIALIAAGAAGLVTISALNKDAIVDWVKGVWEKVKQFWDEKIAPVFTAKFWKDLGIDMINGLIAGFEGGINGIISAFESMINWIIGGLNKLSFENPITGETIGVNISKVQFDRVSIPRIPKLAKGAVIPANREFLAVLGDQKQGVNIEAPLDTIVEAFNIALANNGSTSGNNTIVLEIDGREFGRAVIEQGNRENRRIGTRLVTV